MIISLIILPLRFDFFNSTIQLCIFVLLMSTTYYTSGVISGFPAPGTLTTSLIFSYNLSEDRLAM